MQVAADQWVMQALAEANSVLASPQQLSTRADATLLGGAGVESLALVTLLMAIEERVEDELDLELSLTDALAERPEGFATLETLKALVATLIREASVG